MQYPLADRLHTEILEEEFGKINVQVLSDDDNLREVLLLDSSSTARTYALTMRHKEWRRDKGICLVNHAIRNGQPIGEAFKARGYAIQKIVLDVYITTLPEWLRTAFATDHQTAKARITEFLVKKNGVINNYGIITEIYSPAFRTPEINFSDEIQISIPSRALLMLGFNKDEIWASLENGMLAPNLAKLYTSVAGEVKKKVHGIMMETLPLLAI